MKVIQTSGTRKRAIARATVKSGKGRVIINNEPLQLYNPEFARMKLMEPLLLAKDVPAKLDIEVRVEGGGIISRAEAVRLAIAKALTEHSPKLKEVFFEYDRHLLVADARQRENRKPNTRGNARAKRQKSYR